MKIKLPVKNILIVLFLTLLYNTSFSQQNTDTLNTVKELRNNNEYKKAASLLNVYLKSHPEDVNSLWLLAQTEFWLGNFDNSDRLYKKALKLDPENDYLNLDYARTLTNMGEWQKSIKILDGLESRGKIYSDGEYIRSKILFWQWDFNKAKKLLDDALTKDGSNTEADNLLTDVMIAKSPWIKLNGSYSDDNQPLVSRLPYIEAGKFFSPMVNLFMGVYVPSFHLNGTNVNGLWIQAGNKSFFSDIRLLLQANLGIVKYPTGDKTDWTANINIQKTFSNHLMIEALAEHKPYFNTAESVDTTLSYYHIASTGGWDNSNTVNGKAGFDYAAFNKGHNVYSIFGWIYTPAIKFSDFTLNLGLAYNYSNSNYNTYKSKDSLSYIISNYSSYENLPGVYDPYFTPKDQNISSGLLALIYNPDPLIQIGLKSNIGIYSITKNPYLYLDNDSLGQVYIDKSYSKENFFPASVNFYIKYRIADRMNLQLQYDYNKTYFYISNYIGLNYTLSFWNEDNR